jgi:4-amino-4-deoxy-L-arabinose transferase-like glycosyltransferase
LTTTKKGLGFALNNLMIGLFMRGFLLIFFLWAIIYLPFLSSREIDRGEARRLIPAAEMIKHSDYVNPFYAGSYYYTKPPMVYWIIATNYALFDNFNLFTGRFAIAATTLILALLAYFLSLSLFNKKAEKLLPGLPIVLILLSFGLLNHGREATMESAYMMLSVLTTFSWLYFYTKENSKLQWIVPGLFIGLALLTKGPFLLLPFYIFVISLLYFKKEIKSFFSVYHLYAIVIASIIFLSWYLQIDSTLKESVASTFKNEMLMRLIPNDLTITKKLGRIFASLILFLPTILPTLLLLNKNIRKKVLGGLNDNELNILKSSIISCILTYILINLLPLAKARYLFIIAPMPIISSTLVLIALSDNNKNIKRNSIFIKRAVLIITAAITITFSIIGLFINNKEKYELPAKLLKNSIPNDAKLYLLSPLREPFIFYLEKQIAFTNYQNIEIGQFVLSKKTNLNKLRDRLSEYRKTFIVIKKIKVKDEDIVITKIKDLKG